MAAAFQVGQGGGGVLEIEDPVDDRLQAMRGNGGVDVADVGDTAEVSALDLDVLAEDQASGDLVGRAGSTPISKMEPPQRRNCRVLVRVPRQSVSSSALAGQSSVSRSSMVSSARQIEGVVNMTLFTLGLAIAAFGRPVA